MPVLGYPASESRRLWTPTTMRSSGTVIILVAFGESATEYPFLRCANDARGECATSIQELTPDWTPHILDLASTVARRNDDIAHTWSLSRGRYAVRWPGPVRQPWNGGRHSALAAFAVRVPRRLRGALRMLRIIFFRSRSMDSECSEVP